MATGASTGGVDQPELPPGLGEQRAHQKRTARGMGPQVVRADDGHTPALAGLLPCRASLVAEQVGGTPETHTPIEPAVTPIDQVEAGGFAVVAESLD